MEPDLGSREVLAVVAGGDRDQPELLAAALASRLSPLEFENRSKIIMAEQLGVSRPTVSKWIGRYQAEG